MLFFAQTRHHRTHVSTAETLLLFELEASGKLFVHLFMLARRCKSGKHSAGFGATCLAELWPGRADIGATLVETTPKFAHACQVLRDLAQRIERGTESVELSLTSLRTARSRGSGQEARWPLATPLVHTPSVALLGLVSGSDTERLLGASWPPGSSPPHRREHRVSSESVPGVSLEYGKTALGIASDEHRCYLHGAARRS